MLQTPQWIVDFIVGTNFTLEFFEKEMMDDYLSPKLFVAVSGRFRCSLFAHV